MPSTQPMIPLVFTTQKGTAIPTTASTGTEGKVAVGLLSMILSLPIPISVYIIPSHISAFFSFRLPVLKAPPHVILIGSVNSVVLLRKRGNNAPQKNQIRLHRLRKIFNIMGLK